MSHILPPGLRIRILERDGFRCVYCGATPQQAYLHVDHVLPRSQGGSNDPTNLVTACGTCNSGKSDRTLALPPGVVPGPLEPKPYGRRGRYRTRHVRTVDRWQAVARELWPDAMDMVEAVEGAGRYATVTWCAGLLVILHLTLAGATSVFQRLGVDFCGHGCWHDHELVDLANPISVSPAMETKRLQRRLQHFGECVTCQYVFSGQAPDAATARAVARGMDQSAWRN